ncbi:MAG: MiaB/RimO family radical SAM methylthiotransferase [Burkholderiales bacterium]|nr:MiaB/RimO family radical SAM methylthiotransferase [Phycisphaerae bacterium]
MKTFSISILGCRVNQYEAEQIAAALKRRGLRQVDSPGGDLRVIHTCSVTSQAAKGSRQTIRRATRLPVLGQIACDNPDAGAGDHRDPGIDLQSQTPQLPDTSSRARVVVTGCWATSDTVAAGQMPGVDAVITNHQNVNDRLIELLNEWTPPDDASVTGDVTQPPTTNRPTSLPILGHKPATHQRAFLKIQDGCDAHCTYCIIPQLRPVLSSKSPDDAVAEARALVAAGHREIVLTGIFMGAYGQSTALRRRQDKSTSKPLAGLVAALCTQVPGLTRLRLSSLEPGDLDEHLINELKRHPQVVPHFHLPLQSGSDAILRKMNRQYTSGQFLEMIAMVQDAFDEPAITTDIIVGFPNETDDEFARTLDVVDRVQFIHTHAFSYSPRPKTAAARWTDQYVDGRVANQRIHLLNDRAKQHSLAYRQRFVGRAVSVIVERSDADHSPDRSPDKSRDKSSVHHGRCERYFDVHFASPTAHAGDLVQLRVDSVTADRTQGSVIE